MDNWTIIHIKLSNGQRFYEAVETDEEINPMHDLDLGDGIIKSGTYKVVIEGFTEQEVDDFIDMPIDAQDEFVADSSVGLW